MKNVVVILNYDDGEVITIKLTDEQMKVAESYDTFEDYLFTIEDEYDFSVSNSDWMFVPIYKERVFGISDYYEEPMQPLF